MNRLVRGFDQPHIPLTEVPIVSTLVVRSILRAAESTGVDRAALLDELGLDADALDDPDEAVPLSVEERLWRELHLRTQDPTFGLRAAAMLERGDLWGLEFAIRSSPTLGDGLAVLERFGQLLHGHRLFSLRGSRDGGMRLTYVSPHDGMVATLASDFALASVVVLGRDAVGTLWVPSAIGFRHRASWTDRPYEELFGRVPVFGQAEDWLELDAAVMSSPMREADPVLSAVLQHYLGGQLAQRDPSHSLADRVRAEIVQALPNGSADLDHIADALGLSPRVLQKRLQRAHTSFQEQLDRARESLAKNHLLRPGVTVASAALLLGYSDVTAFHRAFKRWTGLTPGEFRRRARG